MLPVSRPHACSVYVYLHWALPLALPTDLTSCPAYVWLRTTMEGQLRDCRLEKARHAPQKGAGFLTQGRGLWAAASESKLSEFSGS